MVPEGVIVEKVDLAASLAVLSRSLKEKLPLKIAGEA
jgi:NADH/NAD ratio-sensing transcriptional regulator Rex